jgi:hypothetical protein
MAHHRIITSRSEGLPHVLDLGSSKPSLDFMPPTHARDLVRILVLYAAKGLLRSRPWAFSLILTHLASTPQREAFRLGSVIHLRLGIFRLCPWSRYDRAGAG